MIGTLPSGKYRVRVKHHGKVIASKSFVRLKDAQRWEDEQRRQLDLGVWVDPRRGERMVADVAAEWLISRRGQVSSSTWATDRHFVTHLGPQLGNLPIGQVTRGRVEAALGDRSPPVELGPRCSGSRRCCRGSSATPCASGLSSPIRVPVYGSRRVRGGHLGR